MHQREQKKIFWNVYSQQTELLWDEGCKNRVNKPQNYEFLWWMRFYRSKNIKAVSNGSYKAFPYSVFPYSIFPYLIIPYSAFLSTGIRFSHNLYSPTLSTPVLDLPVFNITLLGLPVWRCSRTWVRIHKTLWGKFLRFLQLTYEIKSQLNKKDNLWSCSLMRTATKLLHF